MTPDTFSSLINLGAAGAVIIVVIIFLRYIEKRDLDWQTFFTTLNAANKEDTKQNTDIIRQIVSELDNLIQAFHKHNEHVDDRIRAIQVGTKATKRIGDGKEKCL